MEFECTIRVPDDFKEKHSFLVNFSNGQLRRSSHRVPKITLYNKTKDRTKRKRIIVAETDDLAYVGTNFGSDSTALTNSCQNCIGALDRSTGVMTLYRTELVTLNPYIPGTMDVEVGEEISIPEKKVDTSRSINQTVKLFGSERQKRAFSAAQKNRLESDVLKTALEPAFSHAQANSERTPADSSFQNSGLIPPHNPAAEAPQDVYDINDIISLHEFTLLKNAAEELAVATSVEVDEWRTENRYPEYVLQHILELPSTEPGKSLKAAILLYSGFLIQLHNMNSRKVQRDGPQFEGVSPPSEVLEQLLGKFAESREGAKKMTYSLPVRMKDKIRLHLLVLCLIIDDFSVEGSVLQKDLKITTNKMSDYFRALGCTVKRSRTKRPAPSESSDRDGQGFSCRYILRIPLSFPKPRAGKKRKEY